MSNRSGPAAGTRQFMRRQSDANLSTPNAAGMDVYANDEVQHIYGIQLIDNAQFDASRPLSPSLSMYEEAEVTKGVSKNASNEQITITEGIKDIQSTDAGPQATANVSGGPGMDGISALLAAMNQLSASVQDKVGVMTANATHMQDQMQHYALQQFKMQGQLEALAAQVKMLHAASQSTVPGTNASHACASGPDEVAPEDANDVRNYGEALFGHQQAQSAHIGTSEAMMQAAITAGGNGTNADALQGTNVGAVHFTAAQEAAGGYGMDGGVITVPCAVQNAVAGNATVLRAPVMPNAANMALNAAQMQQMPLHDGINYCATPTPTLHMPNAALNALACPTMLPHAPTVPEQHYHAANQQGQPQDSYRSAARQ